MDQSQDHFDVDVAVVGAGNAGLAAALAALEGGATVLVLERAPKSHRGGNTAYVSRYRFAYDGLDDLLDLTDIDDELASRLLVEPYPAERFFTDLMDASGGRADSAYMKVLAFESYDTIRWLAENGMRFEPTMEAASKRDGRYTWDPGRMLRPVNRGTEILRALFAAVSRKGGDVMYEAEVVELISHARTLGISGVVVKTPVGVERIGCKAVILASGGFEANGEMRSRYLGGKWGTVKVRGTKYNTGELLDWTLRHGAGAAGEFVGAHATMVHSSAPPVEMGDEVCFPHGYPFSLMVNRLGERFVDEGADFYASTYAMYGREVLAQPGGAAFQVFDSVSAPWGEKTGIRRYAVDHIEASTLDEAARKAGIDVDRFMATIEQYNSAIQPGTFDPSRRDGLRTKGLAVDKTNWALPVETPPFEIFPVECGLTFTYGGLATDTDGHVLDSVGRRIPGLYAVGEIAGSFYHNYLGGTGLTKGAVFGRRAGSSAAEFACDYQASTASG